MSPYLSNPVVAPISERDAIRTGFASTVWRRSGECFCAMIPQNRVPPRRKMMRALATACLLLALGCAARAEPVCRSLEACDALIRTSPGVSAYERRGYLHLVQRRGLVDLQQAIADFSAAIALDAGRALSLYGRGMARLMAGDAAGQNEMEAAIMLQPNVAEEFSRYGAE
jgi:hypothetical protein